MSAARTVVGGIALIGFVISACGTPGAERSVAQPGVVELEASFEQLGDGWSIEPSKPVEEMEVVPPCDEGEDIVGFVQAANIEVGNDSQVSGVSQTIITFDSVQSSQRYLARWTGQPLACTGITMAAVPLEVRSADELLSYGYGAHFDAPDTRMAEFFEDSDDEVKEAAAEFAQQLVVARFGEVVVMIVVTSEQASSFDFDRIIKVALVDSE